MLGEPLTYPLIFAEKWANLPNLTYIAKNWSTSLKNWEWDFDRDTLSTLNRFFSQ
jgi:hypothetical protein